MATFGPAALMPAQLLATTLFQDERARVLFAGIAAHSVLPLTRVASSAAGLVLAAAGHTTGWPIAAGGGQSITNALASYLQSLGGRIVLNADIQNLADLPSANATLFDTSVTSLIRIANTALAPSYIHELNKFRPGPGIFKLDFALSDPIPWRSPECFRSATVHLGGSLAEISQSEHDAFYGRLNDRPFVLVVQPSLFDPSRAPEGKHTAWAYCHVPTGSIVDRTAAIEAQIARYRSRLPRLHPRPPRQQRQRPRRLEPQPPRRRHLRRRHDALPASLPPHRPRLSHQQPQRLPLQLLHASRRRSPRHVRPPRRARRPSRPPVTPSS